MKRKTHALGWLAVGLFATELGFAAQSPVQSQGTPPSVSNYSLNQDGILQTIFSSGHTFDKSNLFFTSIGTNGRSCSTCHVASSAWTISPNEVFARFIRTLGRDPIFHSFDGTNSPNADQSNLFARFRASSMLLNKGLIRVGIGIPAKAEFTLDAVDDPYGFASATELSLFRRPMPTTNLRFLTGVMWDIREFTPLTGTLPTGFASMTGAQNRDNLMFDLLHQANDATRGHARSDRDLTGEEATAIVDFENSVTTAQILDFKAGWLDEDGATAGPANLALQNFYVTINDVLGADHFGSPFSTSVMTMFDGWTGSHNRHRAQIARGAVLFNTKPIEIVAVNGLNDALHLPVIHGFCTTCHDSPNVGNHSVALPINIGLTDASRRTPDMPLYTLKNKVTGVTLQTTDPGRALQTGKWQDIGKFKGPVMHGVAARAPYFHNGLAANLKEVVNFYNTRFNVGITDAESDDLVAFLKTL